MGSRKGARIISYINAVSDPGYTRLFMIKVKPTILLHFILHLTAFSQYGCVKYLCLAFPKMQNGLQKYNKHQNTTALDSMMWSCLTTVVGLENCSLENRL